MGENSHLVFGVWCLPFGGRRGRRGREVEKERERVALLNLRDCADFIWPTLMALRANLLAVCSQCGCSSSGRAQEQKSENS